MTTQTGIAALITGGLAGIEATMGISVPMFIWGIVGGIWAFGYLNPMGIGQRITSLSIAALVAAVTTKPLAMVVIGAAAHYLAWWPPMVDCRAVAWPIAIIIGLLCHTVLGKSLIRIAGRIAGGFGK